MKTLVLLALLFLVQAAAFMLPLAKASKRSLVLQAEMKPPNQWLDVASRLYNEIVPWGDPNKGIQSMVEKKKQMVIRYMQKTGCSKEEAEKEVQEYLADKEGYIKRKTAEEEAAKKR